MDVRRLLDEVRVIARNGLEYADDPYDEDRYERLMALVERGYGDVLGLPPESVRDRLAEEFAPVTPKVGATAAVFDGSGRVLLMRRADVDAWCLPGGHLDPGESPGAGVVRETREETGLDVRPVELVDAYELPADTGYDPHGAVTLLYRCEATDGDLSVSHEGEELAYRPVGEVSRWFADHERYARDAGAGLAGSGRD